MFMVALGTIDVEQREDSASLRVKRWGSSQENRPTVEFLPDRTNFYLVKSLGFNICINQRVGHMLIG